MSKTVTFDATSEEVSRLKEALQELEDAMSRASLKMEEDQRAIDGSKMRTNKMLDELKRIYNVA